jgi:hypothetical protein
VDIRVIIDLNPLANRTRIHTCNLSLSPRYSRDTHVYQNYLVMSDTVDVTGAKPIAI